VYCHQYLRQAGVFVYGDQSRPFCPSSLGPQVWLQSYPTCQRSKGCSQRRFRNPQFLFGSHLCAFVSRRPMTMTQCATYGRLSRWPFIPLLLVRRRLDQQRPSNTLRTPIRDRDSRGCLLYKQSPGAYYTKYCRCKLDWDSTRHFGSRT
jgi:hypothetical protein